MLPKAWWQDSLQVGCLCRVLPLGGPEWVGKLVLIIEVIEAGAGGRLIYRICDGVGFTTTLPYYALELISSQEAERM